MASASAAVAPESLAAKNTLASVDGAGDAWPVDAWWKDFGDPQLDKLMDEALAGRADTDDRRGAAARGQAAVLQASGERKPSVAVNAETTRERYSAHELVPPPYAGSYVTDSRLALDFSYDLDFWGRNRKALESARGQRAGGAMRIAPPRGSP